MCNKRLACSSAINSAVSQLQNNLEMPKTLVAGEQKPHIDWIPINNGHCLRVNISGKLDLHLRSEWQRFIRETSASPIRQFEFNFTQTQELSLTGLGFLLLFKEQKKSQRQDIKLCHCNRHIWELLQWTGMDKHFLIQSKPGESTAE